MNISETQQELDRVKVLLEESKKVIADRNKLIDKLTAINVRFQLILKKLSEPPR